MAVTTIVLENAEHSFINIIAGKAKPGSRILDVIISEARTLGAKTWTGAKIWTRVDGDVSAEGSDFAVKLRRPNNAWRLRLDVVHGELEDLEVLNATQKPLGEAETLELLQGKSITFIGCARQCADSSSKTLNRLVELGSLFGSWRALVFENDSTDDTAARIRDFSKHHPVELIQQNGLAALLPERTARLAFARNRLLARALEIGSDYVCVVDMDGPVGDGYPSQTAFLSNFSLDPCWDAVFPVNVGKYYDIWALRHPTLCPGDYEIHGIAMDAALGVTMAKYLSSHHLQIDLSKLEGWLPVDSAFGGMGIYKTAALRETRYIGTYVGQLNRTDVCEHVSVHSQIRERGGLLYINPDFVVAAA